jgi:hypothetical protein
MKKLLILFTTLISLALPYRASGELEEISFVVYVFDCDTNPILDADVKFDFLFYVEEATYIKDNYYYYIGPAFDIVAPIVNGVAGEFRLSEGMMSQNVFYCEINLPDIRK